MNERKSSTIAKWRKPAAFAAATITAASLTVGIGVDRYFDRVEAYNELEDAEDLFDASLKKHELEEDTVVKINEIPSDIMIAGRNVEEAKGNVIATEESFSGIAELAGVGATIILGVATYASIGNARKSATKRT